MIILRLICALAAASAVITAAEAQILTFGRPPWPPADEIGMANTLGPSTWQRCATYLADTKAKSYELSHLRSNTMPQSPFGVPLRERYRPTIGIAGTRHAFNGEETVSGEPGAQGTQMDAIGHFAVLPQAWDGKSEFPADSAQYYGGYKQADVKPTPDSPLQKLGIEKVPPIITTAVLLDAKSYLGHGGAMQPGQAVTAMDIEAMLKAQGLERRGLIPGDVLYIYTGWGDNWKDPDTEKFYYTKGPGLSYDAAQYIADKQVVLLALDNPFPIRWLTASCRARPRRRQARPKACRLRSTTPTSPSLVSTRSRTRTSGRSPRTRCGCRARSSCRCARRKMPVRR